MNNVESSITELECGVPQGSSLGPGILMIINDLPLFTNNVFADLLYAYDTTLYLTGNSQFSVQENLQLSLQNFLSSVSIMKCF